MVKRFVFSNLSKVKGYVQGCTLYMICHGYLEGSDNLKGIDQALCIVKAKIQLPTRKDQ